MLYQFALPPTISTYGSTWLRVSSGTPGHRCSVVVLGAVDENASLTHPAHLRIVSQKVTEGRAVWNSKRWGIT